MSGTAKDEIPEEVLAAFGEVEGAEPVADEIPEEVLAAFGEAEPSGEDAPAPEPQTARPVKVVAVSPAEDERSAFERYLADFRDVYRGPASGVSETATDAATGVGQGVTLGFGEEIASRITPDMDTPWQWQAERGADQMFQSEENIPRTYAEGSAQQAAQGSMRADIADARKRSPIAYGAGELAGQTVAATALTPGVGPGGAALAARMGGRYAPAALKAGANALGGAATGALAGAGYSGAEGDEKAVAGAQGGLYGGAASLAADAIIPGAGKLVRAAAPALKRGADYMRGKATGIMPGQAGQLLKEEGVDGLADLGAEIERLGLHKGPSGLPTSPQGIYRNASQAAEQSGQRIGDVVERMSVDEGVQKPTSAVLSEGWRAVKDMQRSAILEPEKAAARKAAREMRNIEAKFGAQETMSVADVKSVKDALQNAVWDTKQIAGKAKSAEALGELDANMRRQMYEMVEDPAQRWGGASAESAREFRDAMTEHGVNRTVMKASEKRAGQQMGYVPLGITSAMLAAGGAGGAYAGDQDAKTIAGSGLAAAALPVLLSRYGANYAATGLRGAQKLAEAAPDIATGARMAPVSAIAGKQASNASPADSATSDPVHGAMIEAYGTGQDRNAAYAELLRVDPAFRERERLRAQRTHND